MKILRVIFNIIAVFAAALIGNLVGERWRARDLGAAEHELTVVQAGEDGEITVAVNPLMTNFLPAVLLGLLVWPAGWILSFVSGVLTARFMGDQYEQQFDEFVKGFLPSTPEVDTSDAEGVADNIVVDVSEGH